MAVRVRRMRHKYTSVVPIFVFLLAMTGCSNEANLDEPTPATSEVESDNNQTENPQAEDDQIEEETPDSDSFNNGVLATEEITISITDTRVIAPGEDGNLYGDVHVLAVYYDITNLGTTDDSVSPLTAFIFNFEAFQDNDPNRTNSLDQGGVPGDEFRDQQLDDIKPGGTLSHAVAYELDDLETPVELVAGRFSEIGRMTIELD